MISVRRIAAAVLPGCDVDAVMAALDTYGVAPHEGERDRVQRAILKLCDEQGLDDPGALIEAAKRDYRDVLAWAEYPNQLAAGPSTSMTPEANQRLVDADRAQYAAWLDRFSRDDG